MKIATFEVLRAWVEAFGQGHFKLLIILGDPGLGKSRLAKTVLGQDSRLIEGQTTAFELYRELYRHRDAIFVIDDVDGMYQDKRAVNLLKQLCQSEEVKTISWNTAAKQLEDEGIPKSFSTRTRVVIIANEWQSLNKNLGADTSLTQAQRVEEFKRRTQKSRATFFRVLKELKAGGNSK